MAEIAVRVTPKSSRNAVMVDGDVIRVYVTAPPADNEANRAVVDVLAKRLRVPKSSLHIVRGHASRNKVISVADLDWDEVAGRLQSP